MSRTTRRLNHREPHDGNGRGCSGPSGIDRRTRSSGCTGDGYARLISDVEAGRIPAREFSERFTKLRGEQRDIERRTAAVARTADRLERVESDPETWADAFYSRFPLVRPKFSF